MIPDRAAFEKWSLEALGIDQLAQVCVALDQASQYADQSPLAFQNYLESLEAHLPRESEELRLYKLYAKLSPELRRRIDSVAPILLKTQQEMAILASRFWEANKRGPRGQELDGDLRGNQGRGAPETPTSVKREADEEGVGEPPQKRLDRGLTSQSAGSKEATPASNTTLSFQSGAFSGQCWHCLGRGHSNLLGELGLPALVG